MFKIDVKLTPLYGWQPLLIGNVSVLLHKKLAALTPGKDVIVLNGNHQYTDSMGLPVYE